VANAAVRGRPIAPLVLSAQEREYLERQVRRHRVARSLPRRTGGGATAKSNAETTRLEEGETSCPPLFLLEPAPSSLRVGTV
jgi:hypothetical protein